MFVLKKIIASILLPLPLILILSGIGLCLLWFTKWQRLGKFTVTSSLLIMLLLSSTPVANFVISPLENSYSPFDETKTSVSFVMVLGSGHVSDPRLPVTSQIGATSLGRLIEGIRIYKANPGAKLILSGWGGGDPVSNAEVGAKVAMILGIPKSDLITEPRAKDTHDEAKLIKKVIGNAPFALVTSANHMPRAMALFRKQEMSPIAAATSYLVKVSPNSSFSLQFNAGNISKVESAMHEYLGLAWAKLRGLI